MRDNRLCDLWTVIVFVAVFVFYALTSAFVPYPGVSVEFLSSTCFPGQSPAVMRYPLDAVMLWGIVRFAAPGHLLATVSLFSALLGALTITGLFRAAVAGVRFFCSDLTDIRKNERKRVLSDISATTLLTGLGTALIGSVALPLWALGTRPLPGALSVVLGMALLTFALGLRWRCAQDYANVVPPCLWHRVMMGMTFGFAVFLGTISLPLIPVALLGIMFAGGILIRPEVEGRLTYLPWIVAGTVAGLALSVISVALWHRIFQGVSDASALSLWSHWMLKSVPGLLALFLSFSGAAPLVLLALSAALFFGCFPQAYLRFGVPVVGQIAILALMGVCMAGWPPEFWDTMGEPSALATMGVLLACLTTGLLVGSWARNWLDANIRWPRHKAHALAAVIVLGTLGAITCVQAIRNHSVGAGLSARNALINAWSRFDAALPQDITAWIDPDLGSMGLLIRRYASGHPLRPVTNLRRSLPRTVLDGKPFDECLRRDPVLARLRPIGGAPLRLYLRHSDLGGSILCGSIPPRNAPILENIAKKLADSGFGKTPIGRRSVAEIRERGAKAYAVLSMKATGNEAAYLLRRARNLAPENKGILLSLDALGAEGVSITAEEREAVIAVYSEAPWLKAPTPTGVAAFEAVYGPVRAPAFVASHRMLDLLQGNRRKILAQLCAAYRTDPESLSIRERVAALIALPEAEAGALLISREPSDEELEVYLCAYPWTETSKTLFRKAESRLTANDCLAMLYLNKGRLPRERLKEKVSSFFLRDGKFAYALFHVNALLADGHLDEASAFVTGFNVAERLAPFPYLAETLRREVLVRLTRENADEALEAAESWLRSNPYQPSLWTTLLQNPAQTDPERLDRSVRECLRLYPFHPVASHLFADKLEKEAGAEAADRYLAVLAAARKDEANIEDSNANR